MPLCSREFPVHKYDQFYCSPQDHTAIPIGGTLTLTIAKEVSAATVQQGKVLQYTIRYANQGAFALSYVWVWDDVGSYGTLLPSSIAPAGDPNETTAGRVAWYLGTVAPGAGGTLTFAVLVDGRGQDLADGILLVNRAYLGINPGNLPQQAALSATATTTLAAPALQVSKTDGRETVEPGQVLTYTLQIVNAGSVAAAGLVVTDVLPSYVTPTGTANPPADSQAGRTLVWNGLDPLPPHGGSLLIKVPVQVAWTVPDGTVLANRMAVRYANPAGHVYAVKNASNDTTVQAPILAITKSDVPDPVLAGQEITYTLHYTNTGSGAATGTVITDRVPVSTTFIACSGGSVCELSGGVVSWTVGVVPAHSSGSVRFVAGVSDTAWTGMLVHNAAYAISADQGETASGPDVTTSVIWEPGFISGHAFVDADADGTFDAGKVILPGLAVTLTQTLPRTVATDGSGYYQFYMERQGPVSVKAALPPGYFRTTPGEVLLQSRLGTNQRVNFGYAPVTTAFGVIYGTVFGDSDHDGLQGSGENGLPGVTVSCDEALTSPVTTNRYGQYTFRFEAGGPVTITETNPPLYLSTTPDSVQANAAIGSSGDSPVDFGDFRGIKIVGRVFDDQNVNGINDDAAGLAGAVVEAGTESVTTGITGDFALFVAIASSKPVEIREADPPGYVSTNAVPGAGMSRVDNDTLRIDSPVSGVVYAGGEFGDIQARQAVVITGQVWNDNGAGGGVAANGVRDGAEPGLSGAVVRLSSGVHQTTGPSGQFALPAPPMEVITFTESNPTGYISTDVLPGIGARKVDNDTLVLAPLPGGSTSGGHLFGDVLARSVAIVSGRVFDDADENGRLDAGEAGLPGLPVAMEIGGHRIVVRTGPAGDYQFPVAPGAAVKLTTQGPGAGYYPTTMESITVRPLHPGAYPGHDFGYSDDPNTAVIHGIVFDDADSDGQWDGHELGIPGVTVRLDGSTATTTGQNGGYTLATTVPGSHRLVETDLPGYLSTTPNEVDVEVALGLAYEVRFGDISAPACACPGDSYEQDDGAGQRSALIPGQTQARNFCDDAQDWATLAARSGQTFTLTALAYGKRADTILEILTGDGQTVLAANDDHAGTTDYSSRIVWRAPATGLYYVRASNRSGLTGCLTGYDLSIDGSRGHMVYLPLVAKRPAGPTGLPRARAVVAPEGVITHTCPDTFEPDDSWELARPIAPGTIQVHSFDSDPFQYAADKDLVRFEIEIGSTITFTVDPLTNTLTLLELYDREGTALGITGTHRLVWMASTNGTFYLSISPLAPAFGCADAVGYLPLLARFEP